MFACHFYRFAKRENSTKQPLIQFAETMQIEFNSACSLVNPVLKIDITALQNKSVYRYNYCFIPNLSKYYFIDDWTWHGGLWYAQCHVDALATYRNDIFSSVLYVMRATYDVNGNLCYDGNVADSKYPTTAAHATYQSSAINNPFGIDDQFSLNGTFVCGIINSQSQNGAVTYYAFTPSGFLEFCQKLFTYSSGWLNINTSEISEDLQKALVNPFQYVVSCVYLPIDISEIQRIAYISTQTIYFGWWSVNIYSTARIVNTALHIDKVHTISIPRHPLAATRGNYLNLAPYSIYTLRYYPFGTFNIDSEAIAAWNTLDLYTNVDVVTGKAILNICVNGKNNPIRTVEAQVGVDVPTASLQTNFTNLTSGKTAVTVAGAELIGGLNRMESTAPNPADYKASFGGFLSYAKDSVVSSLRDTKNMVQSMGGIKPLATDIFNTAIAASTTAEIQGMQGCGGLFPTQTLTLSGRFLPVVDEDLQHTGRPLMQLRTISSLSGFCMVKDGDLPIAATEREKATIKAFLEGGFYIE